MEEDIDLSMKIIIVGNGRIGKTSLIQRWVKGMYQDEYKKTLGVAFLEKTFHVKKLGEDVTFLLWDTAGQEEYDQLTKEYYKGSSACILAFSITDRDSFDSLQKWQLKVQEQCQNIPTVIVQTKDDLQKEAKIQQDEINQLVQKLHLKMFKTSSKENYGIKEIFELLAVEYFTLKQQGKIYSQPVAVLGEIKSQSTKELNPQNNQSSQANQDKNCDDVYQEEKILKVQKKKKCIIF